MVNTVVKIDLTKTVSEQKQPHFHNRFHPLIPAICQVKQNEVFKIESFDFAGGQIKNNESVSDVEQINWSYCHVLSGPIGISGALPGDILEVEILDIEPLQDWGYTSIFTNNGGFLSEMFPKAQKAIWDFEGIYASSSRHIPGVKVISNIHPGLIGTAPSSELLAEWNRRENELLKINPNLFMKSSIEGSLVGCLEGMPLADKVKREGAITRPRENGNSGLTNLSKGSKLFLPVYIPGANLSLGGITFAGGDKGASSSWGIQTSGVVTLKCNVIKFGMHLYGMRNPFIQSGLVEPDYSKYLTFEGISVDENGKQYFLDALLSYKQAFLNAMQYFLLFGYTKEQIYMLLSAIMCTQNINGIVDVPNACVTLSVPTEVFDFDILPKDNGHEEIKKEIVATGVQNSNIPNDEQICRLMGSIKVQIRFDCSGIPGEACSIESISMQHSEK